MRFADAEAVAQYEGTSIPPLEVRLDLQPGDRVGLLEEVQHPSMGRGYSPLEVIVLGSPEPGWFIGETEDGCEIPFHAGNVADVLHASPSMGGIFDWVKKILPPSPGELMKPPPPPAPLLPAPQAPVRPEERKGFIQQVKSLFMAPPSIKPSGTAGLPAERPPGTIAPREERPSLISVLKPGQKTVIPIVEQLTAPAVLLKPGTKMVIPAVESIMLPATVIPKSAELEPVLVREQKEKELWSKVIAEVAPESGPIEKVVEALKPKKVEVFRPEEVQPKEELIPPNVPERMHRRLKILPMPRRTELLPSLEETARGLATFFHPIDDLWNVFRRARQDPAWARSIAKTGFAREEFETLGQCGGFPTIYDEISSFFHIPWEEMRNRAVVREIGDQEQWVQTDRIWMDIITPLADRMTEAFNLMKPPDLPGQIVLESSDPHDRHSDPCIMTMVYVEEGEQQEAPEPPLQYGSPIAEAEEEGAFTVEEVEEAIQKVEREAASILRAREQLDPSDPEYQEKLAYYENELAERRTILQEMNQALMAAEEPEAKRAPAAKKKPAKRGKKKGKK
jgi:hypothetical protein